MIAQVVSAPALTPPEYPAPKISEVLAEGFLIGVQMVYPDCSVEDARQHLFSEWPTAAKEKKDLDVIETTIGIMTGPSYRPLPLRDVAPGILLGILRANPEKYIQRYQLESHLGEYPADQVSSIPQVLDDAIEVLGAGVISVEEHGDSKRSRFWRRGRRPI